jgi:hypothetical protein
LAHVAQSFRHYEAAFAEYLKFRRVPHVRLEDARAVLPPCRGTPRVAEPGGVDHGTGLKYFDYVVYGKDANLLVELKGRRYAGRPTRKRVEGGARPLPRLECWATLDDLGSLQRWEQLFGAGFEPLLVFAYWCEGELPTGLFEEVFEYRRQWYALRSVRVRDYIGAMKIRSAKWRTVDLSPEDFDRLSGPFAPSAPYPLPADRSLTHEILRRGRSLPAKLPDPMTTGKGR